MQKRGGPLVGKRVLVTRPAGSTDGLVRGLKALGAAVVHIPAIRIAPPKSLKPLDRAIARLGSYDWVVFTSAQGVEAFAARARGLKLPKVAVVGPATAQAVRKAGGRVAKVAKEHRAEALAPALGKVKGLRVLFPAAEQAGPELERRLKAAGAAVDRVTAYRTLPNMPAAARLKKAAAALDLVVFTSASTAENLRVLLGAALWKRLFARAGAASIGPVTTMALRRLAVNPDFEAREYTTEGLLEVLREG